MTELKNHGKKWTKTEDNIIKKLAKIGTSTENIAKQLKRTEIAVRSEATKKGISLKPYDKK